MKLKMKQSVYINFLGTVVNKNDIIDFTDKKQALDFIKVNYAEEVVEEEKVKKPKAEKPKAEPKAPKKPVTKKDKAGE